MRIPVRVYASVALIAGLPATALAAVFVTASVSPSADVAAGATVQVSCWAEGRPETGMALGTTTFTVNSIGVTVTGGTATPATLTGAISAPCSDDASRTCSLLQGSVSWATPPTEGTYTATCTAAWTRTPQYGAPSTGTTAASANLTTVAASILPPVVSPMVGPSQAAVSTTSAFQVVASDPNSPPLPLTYAWSATGGTLTLDAANPAAVSWQAPAVPGSYDVTVTVSNGTSSSSSTKSVSVALAVYQAGLPIPIRVPRRIAAGDNGALFVIDGRQGTQGQVALLTARGDTRGFASLPEPALAVAHGAGVLWVTTMEGNLFKVDPTTGRLLGQVALADGPFGSPTGIAYDSARMTLWVADMSAGRVRVIHPDGTTVATIDTAGGSSLRGPIDVAVDSAGGRAWVLVFAPKLITELLVGEPIATARTLHSFDLDAYYVASFAPRGPNVGELGRGVGLTVASDGRVFASDSFQGTIQVFARTGASVGSIGTFGKGEGQLLNPNGLALMSNGDIAVANMSVGRIDRFGTGAALPVCAGDSDCDGLPDEWESANGLNPSWAGDSLLDGDGDGLNNAEELAHGTNPRNADTDGDGFSDGVEVATGYDPNDPNDHRPVVAATGPAEMPPGLVRLAAVASGTGTCTVEWTQPVGPGVTIRQDDSTGAAVSFVARGAGTYGFDAVAACGSVRSAASRVTVAIRNVPPLVDAGRVVVASPGSSIFLDASPSTDANADSPLTFTWDQILGPAVSGTESGGTITARPRGVGLYAFQATVADPAGASASAEVPVVVANGPVPTAVAAAVPADAQAGTTVVLDASASVVDASGAFHWEQVQGPAVEISGAGQPVASFVPASAGRYAFEVSVARGRLRSPPGRVEVFVSEAGRALPVVTAAAASSVAVNAPVALDATAGSGALQYSWRQVSGPAAGLTYADRASATAVPFAPGFYVFEVSVLDGAAESRPVRVAFEARSGGAAIPQAHASTPRGDAIVGEAVFLDGRASTGATHYRWTQVAGPWVAVREQTALTWFQPHVPGTYAFELEVDDGAVRSAPARVQIDVLAAEEVR